jgi:ABC-2 type transport system ATP-binding protein
MVSEKKNPAIIRTENLTKRYGSVLAVNGLNLKIGQGEIFGLLGPNGAGKTTTTLMLLGLTDPTCGHAYIDGMDCTRHSLEVKNEVGYLPDKVGFYPNRTGRENLIFCGMMNGLDEETSKKRAADLMERVGMTFAADRRTGTYSRGMLQRLGIADVLMKKPRVIIMDEPTSGIDPEGRREITDMIRELAGEEGLTILISSHDLYQIQRISDRVGIFVKGKLAACGNITELGKNLMKDGVYIFDFYAQKDGREIGREEYMRMFGGISGIRSLDQQADGTVHLEAASDIQGELVITLVGNGCVIRDMHRQGGNLDEIYRRYFRKAEAEEEEKNASDTKKGQGEGFGKWNAGKIGEKISRVLRK